MIEVAVFTVVVAHPNAPSVVVLADKSAVSRVVDASGGTAAGSSPDEAAVSGAAPAPELGAQKKEIGNSTTFDTPEDTGRVVPQLLPIWIGHSEAETIMFLLDGQTHSRPLPHDLMASITQVLGSKIEYVIIDRVVGSTFYATVCLNKDGRTVRVDARPSDSIALALRTKARIFVDEDVMNVAAHRFGLKVSDAGELLYGTEDEVERFHSFIEDISPEDFM